MEAEVDQTRDGLNLAHLAVGDFRTRPNVCSVYAPLSTARKHRVKTGLISIARMKYTETQRSFVSNLLSFSQSGRQPRTSRQYVSTGGSCFTVGMCNPCEFY